MRKSGPQQHAPKELKALLDNYHGRMRMKWKTYGAQSNLHKIFQSSAWGDVVQKKALELRNRQVRFICIHFVESTSTTTTITNEPHSPSNLDHQSNNAQKITKTSSNKGILQLRYPLGITAAT